VPTLLRASVSNGSLNCIVTEVLFCRNADLFCISAFYMRSVRLGLVQNQCCPREVRNGTLNEIVYCYGLAKRNINIARVFLLALFSSDSFNRNSASATAHSAATCCIANIFKTTFAP
jgi:hypothetical protein